MLTKKELAARLGIHESTLTSWVKHGIIKAHAYNGHAWLYEEPPSQPNEALQPMGSTRRPSGGDSCVTEPGPRSSDRIEGGVV